MSSHPPSKPITITTATTPPDLATIKHLFTSYTTWLNLDLSFQNFATELSSLPGTYASPAGCLLLARRDSDNEVLGCVAVRPLSSSVCEMKRLYVLPSARGMGVGVALMERAIEEARAIGYRVMRLDTLPSKMGKAVDLYKAMGFKECAKYYESPIEETLFLEKDLSVV